MRVLPKLHPYLDQMEEERLDSIEKLNSLCTIPSTLPCRLTARNFSIHTFTNSGKSKINQENRNLTKYVPFYYIDIHKMIPKYSYIHELLSFSIDSRNKTQTFS